MTDTNTGHIEILDGFAEDTVAISAKGRITRADYETVLIPLIEERIRSEGKVKLLYVLGSEFESATAGAAMDDALLGLRHLSDFARMAVVSDIGWIRMGVKVFAPLFRGPVAVFSTSEIEAAKRWIAEDGKPENTGPAVAATHKLPRMEDKSPEEP